MNIDINQIETYTPTIYVNNSEPDLDETNLNHTEQALKRVTDAANAAILALKSLDSAKIDAAKIVNNLLATDASTVLSGPMGKALGDRLTAAENLLTQLNGEAIKCMFGISDRDLNNATHPGIYLVDFGASSVKNGPDTGEYFTGALFIISSGNFLIQLFFDGNQYFRKRFYNSWTAWIKTTRDL